MEKIFDDLDKYKNAVLSDCIKAGYIMEKITLPKSVYKYRKFDTQYLKESLDGNVFFSNPIDMNVNDPCDCKMEFDTNEVLKTMVPDANREILRKHPEWKRRIEEYKKSLQGKLRVGCFTTCDFSQIEMWDNQYFGDKHRGYCIKYKVEPKYFHPDSIIFLKILYDNGGFDATDAMKNFVEWENLKKKGMTDNPIYRARSVKMVCLGHNHALFKPEKYKLEDEWRMIIPQNRYIEYFGKKDLYTKDFSSIMEAIYLGSEFRNTDKNGEMYEYALEACKRLHIPLYVMKRDSDKLKENIVYNPDK